MAAKTTFSVADPEPVRLHITPFNESLLSTILNPTLLQSASNISYHTLQTFPEADYGFIDLPSAEARKLKTKLHGSILRGSKVRVELARPSRRHATSTKDSDVQSTGSFRRQRSSRRSSDDRVLSGILLPESRRVQRGWVQPAKHTSKRKGDAKPSNSRPLLTAPCLFRMRLPPTVSSRTTATDDQQRARNKAHRGTVMREFSSTTKYSTFLKEHNTQPTGKPVSEFIDGKGWVDEDGNVIEPIAKRLNREQSRQINPGINRRDAAAAAAAAPDTKEGLIRSIRRPSEVDEKSRSRTVVEAAEAAGSSFEDQDNIPPRTKKPRKHSRKSLGQANESETLPFSPAPTSQPRSDGRPNSSAPDVTSSIPALAIKIPSHPKPSTPIKVFGKKEVHPLESLFKRPVIHGGGNTDPETTAEAEAPFSFFEAESDPDPVYSCQMPQTPFTQQDFQRRGIRSAAPTPDTAAPGRRFSLWAPDAEREDSDDHDDDDDAAPLEPSNAPAGTTAAGPPPTTTIADDEHVDHDHDNDQVMPDQAGAPTKPFEETFWENRGETNRAWKRRRRETGKYKKKIENQRLARRNV